MTQRRDILTASGGLLAAFMASGANSQEQSIEVDLTDGEKANIRLVDAFCKGWEAMDLTEVFATMKEDAVYRQSQDTPPVTGHHAISDLMKLWVDDSYKIDYIVEETFARGPVVINRRIDIYHRNNAEDHLEWEGVGLFLIEGGLIREWQDFTMRIQRGRA
ncbi:MAG: nuclear transport factor 2 family protein [Gammaproteobacteria bacterium]|nr:nuclear transport factor 2 family protein [Gammaproteobacteria bacterium]